MSPRLAWGLHLWWAQIVLFSLIIKYGTWNPQPHTTGSHRALSASACFIVPIQKCPVRFEMFLFYWSGAERYWCLCFFLCFMSCLSLSVCSIAPYLWLSLYFLFPPHSQQAEWVFWEWLWQLWAVCTYSSPHTDSQLPAHGAKPPVPRSRGLSTVSESTFLIFLLEIQELAF